MLREKLQYALETFVVFDLSCTADDDIIQEVLHSWDAVDQFGVNLLEARWSTAEAER